jgi:phytoene/squalene synthetase
LNAEGINACADLVARGDPDRFAAVMAAPLAARGRLLVLYAFNLEVARAPWVTQEALIAEMRLQWWRDVVEEAGAGRPPRAHEVAGPLAELIREAELSGDVLVRLITARRWDVYREPFENGGLDQYLEDTGAGLMWLAGLSLGAGAEAEAALRGLGWAQGLVGFLRAVPELDARGRVPLADARPGQVARLAKEGLARISAAKAGLRRLPAPAGAATLAAWQTEALLRRAVAEPERVAQGALHLSEFARRWGLLRAGMRGRL